MRDDGTTERWTRLGDDLAARLEAGRAAERAADADELRRAELARLRLVDRLRAQVGTALTLGLRGGALAEGRVTEVGRDVVVLAAGPPTGALRVVVPLDAVRTVRGAGPDAVDAGGVPACDERLGLAAVLRRAARERRRVRVRTDDDPTTGITGTVDVVAADHLELAEHPADVAPRRHEVRSRVLVPYAGLVSVSW